MCGVCRLHEEVQLLEQHAVAKSRRSLFFNHSKHTDYMVTLIFNRLHCLRAVARLERAPNEFTEYGTETLDGVTDTVDTAAKHAGECSMICCAPPRIVGTPWVYYEDNTVGAAMFLFARSSIYCGI